MRTRSLRIGLLLGSLGAFALGAAVAAWWRAPARSDAERGVDEAPAPPEPAGRPAPGPPRAAAPRPAEVPAPTPTGTLCGEVLAPGGRPAVGALVNARSLGQTVTTQADAAGRYCVDGLAEGTWGLLAQWKGQSSEPLEGVPLAAGERLEGLVLKVGGGLTLRGRVLDAQAQAPLVGARLSASSGAWEGLWEGVTDRSGAFEVTGLPRGRIELRATAEGYEAAHSVVDLSDGRDVRGIELFLRPLGRVKGSVRAPHGPPVPGAVVVAEAYELGSWRASAETRTDADGRFSLPVASGTLRLLARKPGYAAGVVDDVVVEPGEAVGPVEILLRTAGSLRVAVLRADGTPAVGASVRAGPREGPWVTGTTGADGEALLSGLSSGTVAVEGVDPAAVPPQRAEGEAVVSRGMESRITLVLSEGGYVTGRVLDAQGRPVEGVPVVAHAQGGARGGASRSDRSGAFSIPAPPGRPLTLVAHAPDGREARYEGALAGEEVDLVLQAVGRLVGQVLDSDGQPLVEFTVVTVPKAPGPGSGRGGYRRVSVVDESGDFAIEGLPPGDYWVKALAPGYATGRAGPVWVPEGGEGGPVRIELDATAVVSGRVLGPEGEPVRGARVSISLAGLRGSVFGGLDLPRTRSGADGRYTLRGVPPGTHRILAYVSGRLSGASAPLDLEPGARRSGVEIRMRRLPLGHHRSDAPRDFGGVGMTIARLEAGVTVLSVVEGGPAFLGGVRTGDRLLAVDGVPVAGLELEEIVRRIRGPVDTMVRLRFLRSGSDTPFEARLVRVLLKL